jgi:uncharacterized protein (DUF934 family)
MPKLIKNRTFVSTDKWHRITDDEAVTEYSIISLERWKAEHHDIQRFASSGKLGLFVTSEQTIEQFENDFRNFAVICIDFPKFSDGRGYSAARLLRERLGYSGEIRAVGDVLIDQLFFMQRVGFNAFELRDDQEEAEALAAFTTFSQPYQGDVTDSRPLFRRKQRA